MASTRSKMAYSRYKARRKMKEKFPLFINYETVVHHIDHNPLNNNIMNLTIMENGKHLSYHQKGKLKGIRPETFKKIDLLFLDYNWNK